MALCSLLRHSAQALIFCPSYSPPCIRSLLFIPRLSDAYAVWMGHLKTPEEYKAQAGVDECYYVDELADVMRRYSPSVILRLKGQNTDSKSIHQPAGFEGQEDFNLDDGKRGCIGRACVCKASPPLVDAALRCFRHPVGAIH